MTSSSTAGHLTGFREIWTETVRNIYAEPEEANVIRFTRPDGTVIWATTLVVSIMKATGAVHLVTVYGITESGEHVQDLFWECADEYPGEIASLIPALVNAAGG